MSQSRALWHTMRQQNALLGDSPRLGTGSPSPDCPRASPKRLVAHRVDLAIRRGQKGSHGEIQPEGFGDPKRSEVVTRDHNERLHTRLVNSPAQTIVRTGLIMLSGTRPGQKRSQEIGRYGFGNSSDNSSAAHASGNERRQSGLCPRKRAKKGLGELTPNEYARPLTETVRLQPDSGRIRC